ncbi:4Fe-4S ferredoxin iron-sulfur binding domain protein [Methanocaldococcus fervens AG86]|uniref:4Fe-4S ferredoxin iron-sulfur binding domain protein n=1 Tax=Methanocaldococcus fervens (strain DSM 4213 / JCM 15782 / AG86) TaxID=573064 RepID=C7P6J0_METFA|nr:4Fe-4S ferredoxin iron-sulfur binding domain protein [Methanocaldococcus fervens AG86]
MLIEIKKPLNEILAKIDGDKECISRVAQKITPITYKLIYVNETKCVRCNLCYKECPVDAIEKAKIKKPAKIIHDKCVKCEICAQTCPVGAIYVIEGKAEINNDEVNYEIKNKVIPHRKIRLKNYELDESKCIKCGICARYCPTDAIKVVIRKSIDVNLDSCMGCGACAEVCPKKCIRVESDIGEVIKTRDIEVNKDLCVGCFVCIEECPINAIEQEGDKVKINKDKCILCGRCADVCPANAIDMWEK